MNVRLKSFGDEFQGNTFTDGQHDSSSITELCDGSIVVIRTYSTQDGDSFFIFGQRFTSNDAPKDGAGDKGSAADGQTRTADISDIHDASNIAYQWLRDWIETAEETSTHYAQTQADLDTEITQAALTSEAETPEQSAHRPHCQRPSDHAGAGLGQSELCADMIDYFAEQMDKAETTKEQEAVRCLKEAVSDMLAQRFKLLH